MTVVKIWTWLTRRSIFTKAKHRWATWAQSVRTSSWPSRINSDCNLSRHPRTLVVGTRTLTWRLWAVKTAKMAACADLVWSKTKLAHLTRRTIDKLPDPTPPICRIQAMVSPLKLPRNSLWMVAVNSWQLLSKATDKTWACPKLLSKL